MSLEDFAARFTYCELAVQQKPGWTFLTVRGEWVQVAHMLNATTEMRVQPSSPNIAHRSQDMTEKRSVKPICFSVSSLDSISPK